VAEPALQQVSVSDLMPSPFNPRKDFDKETLAELVESIREQGILTPLLVREAPTNGASDRYEIVAGERRYRAAKSAGLKAVPCIVRPMTDQEAREAQIIENLQRKDITALEEAQGFKAVLALGVPLTKILKDEGTRAEAKGGVEHLAKAIGKSPRYVYARLKLLELADPVKKALEVGEIEASHAQELVPLKPEQQKEMLKRIKDQKEYDDGMSVTVLRDEIKYRYAEKPAPPAISAKEKARRAKELERQKKADAAYKRQQAKTQAEQKRKKLVNARAIAALWPKLKAAGARDRDWFLDLLLREYLETDGAPEAWIVSQGKPLPEQYVRVDGLAAKLEKRPRAERLALILLAHVITDLEWGPAPLATPMFRWAKIDRKAIGREIVKQDAEHARADAARLKKAAPKVQTSAKPAKKGKAPHARKAKAKK
jgi:ParB/RepB/Spo0J family partition protein